MAYGTATLTGKYETFDGQPASGVIEIIPNSRQLIDPEGDVILSGRVKVTLDETGAFSVTLPATDDATVEPATGRQYTVVAKLRHTHLAAVTGVELATGATVDLADVASSAQVDATATRWYETDATISGDWDFTSAPTVNGSPIGTGGGGGAVDSVNGKTGAVTLSASDVGAQPAGSYATAAQGALADTALQPGEADPVGAAATAETNAKAYTNTTVGALDIPTTAADVGAEPAGTTAALDASLAPVAKSGAYSDLTAKPTIPTTAADVNALPDTTTAADIGAQPAATLDADTAARVNDTASQTRAALSATFAKLAPAPSGDTTGVTDYNRLSALLAAVPATGGTIRLQAGTYYLSAGLTITNRTHLVGEGGGGRANNATVLSYVPASGVALTVAAHGSHLEKFALESQQADPADVYGVDVESGNYMRMTDLTVSTFNVCITINDGSEWHLTRVTAYNPKLYGLNVAHTDHPDEGDQTLTDCNIVCRDWSPTAGIRWASGGGMKIVNTKFNNDWRDPTGVNLKDKRWKFAIYGEMATGVDTSCFQVSNCSIENFYDTGFYFACPSTSLMGNIQIGSNEFLAWNTGEQPDDHIRSINIYSADQNAVDRVHIGGNIHNINGGTAKPAIELTNCRDVLIDPQVNSGFPWLVTTTSCTQVTEAFAFDGSPRLQLNFPQSGVYVRPMGQIISNVEPTQGLMYFTPIRLAKTWSIDRITASVKATNPGATVRLGLYADDGNGHPSGAPLVASGALDASVTGLVEFTTSQLLEPGLYWIACVTQGAASTLAFMRPAEASLTSGWAPDLIDYDYVTYVQEGVTGALPTVGSLVRATNAPAVALRLA